MSRAIMCRTAERADSRRSVGEGVSVRREEEREGGEGGDERAEAEDKEAGKG